MPTPQSTAIAESLESRQLLSAIPIPTIRINAGGPAYTDSFGQAWTADQYFAGGSTNQPYPVANTLDDSLYSSRRWGSFSYNIPTPAATYVVNLYLSEPRDTAIGQRLFNVSAENQRVLTNVDAVKDAGYQTAFIDTFKITTTDGVLNLRFAPVKDVAMVSAIEVLPIPGTVLPAVPTNVTAVRVPATKTVAAHVHVAWNETPSPYYSTEFDIERGIAGDLYENYLNGDRITNDTFDDYTADSQTNYTYSIIAYSGYHLTAQSAVIPMTPLPAPWHDTDIGSVNRPGDAGVSSNNGMHVTGSGADIFNSADAFNFDYQSLTGNTTIIAQLSSQTGTNPWAKSGIMIRENLSPNSPFAMLVLTPGHGLSFESRTLTAQAATSLTPSNLGPWLKLTRTANRVAAFTSTDGKTWTPYTSINLALGSTIDIGLCVTAHNNNTISTAVFNNVSITH